MKKPKKKAPVQRKDPSGYYTDWIDRKKALVESITHKKKEDS